MTIVPLRFTSITTDNNQVERDNPLYAFLYNEKVRDNI